MNTRVSQFELHPSVEPNSSRTESFASQPERSFATSSTSLVAADSSNDTSSLGSETSFTKSENLSSRIPFYLIGLLLTATAIAKLWMLLTDSFADIRVGLPKEILWLSVAFELWLANENFRLRDHRVMAFVNTIVFSAFAIFSSIRLAMGYGSCGCSGSLEIPAWVFILIDLMIVTWFVSATSRRKQIANGLRQLLIGLSSSSLENRGRIAGIGILISLIVGMQLSIASPIRTLILGEIPVGSVALIKGDLLLNRESTGQVEIHNRSGESAKIIGMSRSCGCFVITEDTVAKIIPANGHISLSLLIRPNKTGSLHQRITLFLDHPKQFRVNIDVLGSVKGVEL